jgi:hypothetical protein
MVATRGRTVARTAARRFALDPRLLIGLLLVAGSVAGVVGIVSTADDSVQVYAAARTLTPGQRVTADDLTAVSVRLDSAASRYVSLGALPAGGVLVGRTVASGELVPISALGTTEGSRLASLVLVVAKQLPGSLVAGTTADVWAAVPQEGGEYETARVIVSGAVIVRLIDDSSIVSGSEVTGIEVLVPRSSIARVLDVIANDAVISLVPTALPIGEG